MRVALGLALADSRPAVAGGGGGGGAISILRGYNPLLDHGTSGDFFVDAVNGSDANSGLSANAAKQTLAQVIALGGVAGKHIKIRGGVYDYTFSFAGIGGSPGARTKISRYGLEQVINDAQDTYTGWTQCGAGDAAVLGSVLGVAGSSVYKKTVAKSTIASSDPAAAFPFENGVKLRAAMARKRNPGSPESEGDTADWLTATTTVQASALKYDNVVGAFTVGQIVTGATSGATGTIISKTTTQLVLAPQTGAFIDNEVITDPLGGNALANGTKFSVITGYRFGAVTTLYSAAQILNASVLLYGNNNTTNRSRVASVGTGTDGVANTINLVDQSITYNAGKAASDKFALINILPALKAGEWGYTDDDATNCTLYIRPSSPANMASGIKISRRGKCVDFADASHCEIEGLICRGASSSGGPTDGNYAINAGGTAKHQDLVTTNCSAIDTYRVNEDYAPIWMGNVDGVQIRNCTVKNAYNQFGIFCQGGDWRSGLQAVGTRIDRCVIENSDKGPYRFYGQFNAILSFSTGWNCGRLAHANKFAFYQGCHECLVWACAFEACGGYGTHQEASRLAYMFNYMPVDYTPTSGDAPGRGFDDQNHTSPTNPSGAQSYATNQGVNGDSHFSNNELPPYYGALASVNSVTLGYPLDPAVLYTMKNNILHGADTVNQTYLKAGGCRTNLMTSGSVLAASAGTDTTALPGSVYTDPARGDVSIKAGSPSRSAATTGITADIADLREIFPDFTGFDYDMTGRVINHASPPMGPFVDPSVQLPFAPVWIDRPALTGTGIVGQVVGVTDGYLSAYPFPASKSYQWVTSDDEEIWTDVSGQTAATWIPGAGVAGKFWGVRVSTGGLTTIVSDGTQIISSYALGDPAVLASDAVSTPGSSTFKQRRILITASNKPLTVFVSQKNASAADATVTLKIGAVGRTFGTGTDFGAPKGRSRRTSADSMEFQLLAPGSGALEIQYESSLATFSLLVVVVEQAGQTDLNLSFPGGATTVTSRSLTETTDATNAGVFWFITRFSGDPANPITMTGVDAVLFNGTTGGTSTGDDLTVAIGYEKAASIGAYAAAATWPTAATVATLAMQVKS